jgi:HEAT repeat protein
MRTLCYASLALASGFSAGAQTQTMTAAAAQSVMATFDRNGPAARGVPVGTAWSTTAVISMDPPDSLYRVARGALTDGDFKKAATLFATVAERFPDSEFAPDALYYRAYALYKSGSSRELNDAVVALDRQASRYPKAGTLSDAKQLRASIRSEQAKRGDGGAGLEIASGGTNLSNQNRCPTDDDDMRLTALAGIVQLDPDQVLPVLQKLLSRRDECSVALRKRAVYMVAQTKEEERAEILLNVARTDPSVDVRRDAVQWLSSVNTERAAKALDSILFSPGSAEMRERALSALSQHRSPAARESLRRFAEMNTVPTDLRVRAINYMSSGRKGGDETEYFRSLFTRTASPEIREAIIQAVANQKTPDRTSWLLGVARDKNHEIEVRKRALYYAGQSGVEVKDVIPLYDEFAGQKEMQDQMLYVYGQRRETEATDKLLQIARTEKDPDLRRKAVQWLGARKNDPRVTKFLLELLDQPVR